MKDVCYLIPYYNGYDDLIKSLASLTEGVDVVVVDDGSKQPLCEQLNVTDYAFDITILTQVENNGIEYALNAGLEYITPRYRYVARLDAGDLSVDGRIKKQLAYIRHSGDVLVGAWAQFVDENYMPLFVSELPETDAEIRKKMYLNNVFVHPSVLMDVSVFRKAGLYPVNRKYAEDYALFFNLMKLGTVSNVPEPLIKYVVSSSSISTSKRRSQIVSRIKVCLDNFNVNYSGWFAYGLIRSLISLMVSRDFTTRLRKLIKVY